MRLCRAAGACFEHGGCAGLCRVVRGRGRGRGRGLVGCGQLLALQGQDKAIQILYWDSIRPRSCGQGSAGMDGSTAVAQIRWSNVYFGFCFGCDC